MRGQVAVHCTMSLPSELNTAKLSAQWAETLPPDTFLAEQYSKQLLTIAILQP